MKIIRDGQEWEQLVTLALPLPLEFAGQLMGAVSKCAEAYGYTEVSLLTDDTSRIVARPPDRTGSR